MGFLQLKPGKRIRRFFVWIWRQEGTSTQRSMGIAIGIFSGCFPLFGLQTLIGVLLATLFKANRFLAVVGTWISNPLTYFPLYWLNFKVGSFFFGPFSRSPSLDYSNRHELLQYGWIFSLKIFLGSLIVGSIFGLTVGLILYLLLSKSFFSRYK